MLILGPKLTLQKTMESRGVIKRRLFPLFSRSAKMIMPKGSSCWPNKCYHRKSETLSYTII